MKPLGPTLGILLTCGLLLRPAQADPMPEYAMKAAYLYNFALFTEWPASGDSVLNLCVIGKDPFGPALDSIDGKVINGMRLSVRRQDKSDNLKACQILFVSEAEEANWPKWLKELEEAPVLTVTDDEELLKAGAMIGLSVENRHLTFAINAEAAKRAHLSISSKLLRLAKAVH